ncbi:hypothetical protein OXX80_002469 [Metschnikowia pulcherrima]
MRAAKRVIRYLSKTRTYGIVCSSSSQKELTCFCDANSASESDADCRSTTGSFITYADIPVSWKSKLQTMVAVSTLNSELVSLFYTTCEAVWLQNLLAELGLGNNCYILCDNQGAIQTVKNGSLLQRSKHIRVKAHFVKQTVELRNMTLSYIHTKDNIADIFTKALPPC